MLLDSWRKPTHTGKLHSGMPWGQESNPITSGCEVRALTTLPLWEFHFNFCSHIPSCMHKAFFNCCKSLYSNRLPIFNPFNFTRRLLMLMSPYMRVRDWMMYVPCSGVVTCPGWIPCLPMCSGDRSQQTPETPLGMKHVEIDGWMDGSVLHCWKTSLTITLEANMVSTGCSRMINNNSGHDGHFLIKLLRPKVSKLFFH